MATNGVIGIAKLVRDLDEVKKANITVGYQGDSGKKLHPESASASIAEVASYMEFGTKDIPARPFLRTALKQHAQEIKTSIKKALASVIDQRKDVEDAVAIIGDAAVDAVHSTIENAASWAAPLSPKTVKTKGSSSPLVDTGAMKDNASWAHRDKQGNILKQGGER